ncbi:hypothetical protein ACFVXQ_33200 [Kitasatospora sp. NPDC058263]
MDSAQAACGRGRPTGVHFDRTHATRALAGSDIACPPIDRAVIDRYLAYFTGIRTPAPPSPTAGHA